MGMNEPGRGRERVRWFGRGLRAGFSLPGLMLTGAIVGFVGLARESGLGYGETLVMTAFVWALPAQVVLIGMILSGASLPAASLAVGLSSVRLMPMAVALMPDMRAPKMPQWVLYLLSHFVAVTAWVIALERLPAIPREMRAVFFAGLGVITCFGNTAVVAVAYPLVGGLPPLLSAGLFMLTPIYFLMSMWKSAREPAAYVALGCGVVLGPVFHVHMPQFDLLAAGLIGGAIAYAYHLLSRKRRS